MGSQTLHGGDQIPALGLGTWLSEPGQVYRAVRAALEVGYRHVDCAWIYQNEPEIGRAFHDAFAAGDVRREELFVTSKLWNNRHAPEDVPGALDVSLRDLQLEYLDLYLIHWPVAHRRDMVRPQDAARDYLSPAQMPLEKTWEAMVALKSTAKVRNVGVSNFSRSKIETITAAVGEAPACDQVELHPFNAQNDLVSFCREQGIAITGYSPLGSKGRPGAMKREDEVPIIDNAAVKQVAADLSATPAQVLLAWAMQRGTVVIPKSVTPSRIEENLGALNVELRPEQMQAINALDRGERYVDGTFWCEEGSPYTVEALWG